MDTTQGIDLITPDRQGNEPIHTYSTTRPRTPDPACAYTPQIPPEMLKAKLDSLRAKVQGAPPPQDARMLTPKAQPQLTPARTPTQTTQPTEQDMQARLVELTEVVCAVLNQQGRVSRQQGNMESQLRDLNVSVEGVQRTALEARAATSFEERQKINHT